LLATADIGSSKPQVLADTRASSSFESLDPALLVAIFVAILGMTGIIWMIRRSPRMRASAVRDARTESSDDQRKNTDVLRIFRTGNEYRIEYRDLYERSIKVLEENRKAVIEGIRAFVSSVNRLAIVRGTALDELASLPLSVPDLKTSGNTIYRLFLSERIREALSSRSGDLVIRTDEQEIPWEIMHDGTKFLALSYPIARGLLVSGEIRVNPVKTHRKPRILFIVNPTGDLPGTEREVETIIAAMRSVADMTVVR